MGVIIMLLDSRIQKSEKELAMMKLIQGGIKKTVVAAGTAILVYGIEVLKKCK